MGNSDCITFQMTGQIPIPGLAQMKQAAAFHQKDMNPMGVAEALDENAKDDTPIIKRVYWKNEDGNEINELPEDIKLVTLCADIENANIGANVEFCITRDDGTKKTVNGVVGSDMIATVKNYDITQ